MREDLGSSEEKERVIVSRKVIVVYVGFIALEQMQTRISTIPFWLPDNDLGPG